MKRSPMPPRTTPLPRGGALIRRTPLRAESDRRRESRVTTHDVKSEVFVRDGRCLLSHLRETGGCLGPATFHHLRKAGAGGGYTVENGVLLCERHNGWVEDWPQMARRLGLVVGVYDRIANVVIDYDEAARRRDVYGLVPRRTNGNV